MTEKQVYVTEVDAENIRISEVLYIVRDIGGAASLAGKPEHMRELAIALSALARDASQAVIKLLHRADETPAYRRSAL